MVLSPDTFLLVVISSGVFIIVVGMIVAVNCPYHVLSFTFCFKHCKKLCRRCCCCRKKEKNWKHNIINYSDRKYGGAALVEGRPQGHGFYTSGAWSSTETTTTCIDGTIRNSILTAEMIGRRFSSTDDDNRNDEETSGSGLATGTVYGNSDDLNLLSPGQLSTVSHSALPLSQVVCVNCHGIGFVERMEFPTYLNGGSSNNASTSGGDESRYLHQPGNHYHFDGGSSSGCLSTGSDLAMASDVDVDADADMMMMFM